MKKYRFTIAAAALAVLAVVFSACGIKGQGGSGKYGFDEEGETKILGDLGEYHIIRGDLCSDTETDALVKLRTTIEKSLGITVTALTDWIGEGQEEQDKEILIGNTNREESVSAREGLGYHDFVICMDGSKLVITGGSDVGTAEAVDYFIEHYIDVFASTLSYPDGDGYRYVRTYSLDSFTINGAELSEYRLYAYDEDIDLAKVQSALSDELVGIRVEIDDMIRSTSKYIIFDNTSLLDNVYSIALDEHDNLIISGSYRSFDTAFHYFCGGFFEELASKKGKTPDFTSEDAVTKEIASDTVYSRDELVLRLDELSENSSFAVGEMLHGSQSMPAYTLEIYSEATGAMPAVIGVDLGERGLRLSELSDTDYSRAVCELTDFARKGGIITVTAGFSNPAGTWELSGGKSSGTLGGDDAWKALFTDGSELNLRFREELVSAAAFLGALSDNGVTVLWSPLYDRDSENCWFALTDENAEHIKQLWIYIYRFFENIGAENLIWVYAPSLTKGASASLEAYPGGGYADYVGGSITVSSQADFERAAAAYAELLKESGKKGTLIRFALRADSALAAKTKAEQNELFGSSELLESLIAFEKKGGGFAGLVTDYGTSSVDWLGGGKDFVSNENTFTLDETELRKAK